MVAGIYAAGVGLLTYLIYTDTQQPRFRMAGVAIYSGPPMVDSIPGSLAIAAIVAVPLAGLPGAAVALWKSHRPVEAGLATGASLGMLAVVAGLLWTRRYGLDPDMATLDTQLLYSALFFAPWAAGAGAALWGAGIVAAVGARRLRREAGPPQFGVAPARIRPRA